jgi:hypothetical protein
MLALLTASSRQLLLLVLPVGNLRVTETRNPPAAVLLHVCNAQPSTLAEEPAGSRRSVSHGDPTPAPDRRTEPCGDARTARSGKE